MPHQRKRYAQTQVQKALAYSPIVGIIGQRQVGKTTLLERCTKIYTTLDRESSLLEAEANPELFLRYQATPFAIDEAQLCPRLFPALKERVRTHKKPGQYLLSGSVRFTSREAIRESLTGRIISVELLPFTISEIYNRELTHTLETLLKIKKPLALEKWAEQSYKNCSENTFNYYLQTGGLPGICFFRETSIRIAKFENHINTLLNRDLRLVSKTNLPYTSLRALLEYLSKNQGNPFALKAASDFSQISPISIKKILYAYEALFLIRPVLSIPGGEKKITYFFEDQGFATWINNDKNNPAYDIMRGLYANLRQEYFYKPKINGKIQTYRTKNGVHVPLVFSSNAGILGVISSVDSYPAPKILAGAQAFLKKYPHAKVIIATRGKETVFKTEQIFLIPYYFLV
ncbi:MAG: ATP-binding protein [Deltaproteobacteria bacterium]|nr:ATP-binding protein [Deltaproteobacteria bacterium]